MTQLIRRGLLAHAVAAAGIITVLPPTAPNAHSVQGNGSPMTASRQDVPEKLALINAILQERESSIRPKRYRASAFFGISLAR